MKALVAVKRVVDYQAKVRIKPDGSDIETHNVKMSMNPFDEIAVEQVVQLKEQGIVDQIIVASIGGEETRETLRQALAMGADKALLVKTSQSVQPLAVANALKIVVEREGIGLAVLGKQAIDDDSNQTGQMLAALLDWPQGTFASELKLECDHLTVTREVDSGLEVLRLELPAVITADLRLNTPRYLSLPSIMQAKTKPLEVETFASLNVPDCAELTRLHLELPAKRKAGPVLNTISELMHTLKEQGVLP